MLPADTDGLYDIADIQTSSSDAAILKISSFFHQSIPTNRFAQIQVSDGSGTYRNLILQPSGGNVGIGTITPGAKLDVQGAVKIVDGTQGDNKVLTSDVSGNASWQTLVPSGTILIYAGATVPTGYLLCDGSQVSRTTYANLYSALGDAWGNGDGSTTFHIPDMRGVFPRGVSAASTNDPDKTTRTASNSGGNTGNNVGSFQADQLKNSGTFLRGGGGMMGAPGGAGDLGAGSITFGGNETRPKNVYVNYIIKY
ncbi:MAG: tail fiber protein [Bacteroidetes bacterium]|nr:MAG: tail fiber protein [Bacteroidota bacterium]